VRSRVSLLAVIAGLLLALLPGAAAAEPPDARAAVAAMQPGWNLGNTFDAIGADETAWGNPRVTKALLRGVRAQGFKSIRIPVTWDGRQGPAPDYTIDPAWLARVQEVVRWALAEDLYVMINLHHDSWLWVNQAGTSHDQVLARYTATWEQLAAAFRDAPHRLVLESVNEPQFAGTSGDAENYALLHELNTVFHRIVRSSGGRNATRLLVLPTLHTNGDQGRLDALTATFDELDDPNLVATIHFYGFWPFSVNVAGVTRFDATTEADLVGTFDRAYQTFVARGIPVIIGEYGLLGFDVGLDTVEQGEKLKFFDFFGNYARARELTTMWWDNGQHLGRTTLRWSDPLLYQQIKSSWTVRSSSAELDLLFVRKSGPIADTTMALNLNGNRLRSIALGSRTLVRGQDYTLDASRSTVTFSAALLARLRGAYGENAVLSAKFSRGVPWRFRVITYDPPVAQAASGTTDGTAVPMAFNGDLLATMEATYADGSGNAGPHNWTSYKEFGRAFRPDYAAGVVNLPAAFFQEVRDGVPVQLTFHFWSGTKVTYTVVRSGSVVTGTPSVS
jgi:endoglucanase